MAGEPASAGGANSVTAAFGVGLAAWPLRRARLQLALRHVAAPPPARRRVPRAARDTFDARGTDAWAERVRRELRAAGECSGQPASRVLDLLAPQELHIAWLAAEGLTNREIGQRLYLSHRTVSNHPARCRRQAASVASPANASQSEA
jgi:hypothetical protein